MFRCWFGAVARSILFLSAIDGVELIRGLVFNAGGWDRGVFN